MSNGCPVCGGLGRVLAFGVCREPTPVTCPECAGLAVTPASADDQPRVLAYSARDITSFLLGPRPALPSGPPKQGVGVELAPGEPEGVVAGDDLAVDGGTEAAGL